MATCLDVSFDGQRVNTSGPAAVEVVPDAAGGWGDTSQDDGAAPRQNLLHAFSTPVGGILFVSGLVMIVLPGPSVPLLVVGLGLLGREYAWARRVLDVVGRRVPARWRPYVTLRAAPVTQANVSPSKAA